MKKKLVFEIPPGTKQQSCLSCGRAIFWIVTAAAKRMPVDPDGQSHFATCSSPAAHRGRSRAEFVKAQADLFGGSKK